MEMLPEEKNLLEEIRATGVEIDDIEELMHMDQNDKALVPIVVKYIKRFEETNYRELLVRALGVKGFTEASDVLLDEFYKAENGKSYKWAIGNTISIIADPNIVSEMIEISLNKEHGAARGMIVYELGRFKDERIKDVLISLLDDEIMKGYALHSLKLLKDESTRKYAERFLDCDIDWVRKEAESMIRKLDKLKIKEQEKEKARKAKEKEREKARKARELEREKVKKAKEQEKEKARKAKEKEKAKKAKEKEKSK